MLEIFNKSGGVTKNHFYKTIKIIPQKTFFFNEVIFLGNFKRFSKKENLHTCENNLISSCSIWSKAHNSKIYIKRLIINEHSRIMRKSNLNFD